MGGSVGGFELSGEEMVGERSAAGVDGGQRQHSGGRRGGGGGPVHQTPF